MDCALETLRGVAVDLEVTSVCDAACGFCPRETMPDKKRFVSENVVERLASDLKGSQAAVVVLCGIGESMLHPKLDWIVSVLSETGVRVEMTTHGKRMHPDRFEELVGHGLSGVNFSLNAATAATHAQVMRLKSFEETIKNVEGVLELKARKYPSVLVHASFVVCNLNCHEVEPFVEFWRQKGLSKIWLHPVNNRNGLLTPGVRPVPMHGLAADYDGDDLVIVDLFGDLESLDNICKIARGLIFVSADGEVRLCAMDYRRVTSYGNLMTRNLEAMHRDKLQRYSRGELNRFCQGCDFCPTGIRELRIECYAESSGA